MTPAEPFTHTDRVPSAHEPCQVCGRWDNRAVAVDIVAVRDDAVLLVRRGRNPFQGWWALPGGHVERGEDALTAACRELREETGTSMRRATIAGVFTDPGRDPKQTMSIAVLAEVDGEPAPGDDAAATGWWPLEDLPPLAFDHRTIIDTVVARLRPGDLHTHTLEGDPCAPVAP